MPEKNETQLTLELEAVANNKNFTTIPNSTSEFCIYTYKADYESYNQITRPGFFDPAYSFLNAGDVIRVFRFEDKKLVNLLEFVVMEVDKTLRKVIVATLSNTNLERKVIGS